MEPKSVEVADAISMPPTNVPRDNGHDNRVFADETGLPHLANGKPHQQTLRNFENSKL